MTFSPDSHPDIVEDAVKYIIFLVDADRLFDTALGMYDFSLVLMVAQHAQKVCITNLTPPWTEVISNFIQDPREYLPFLRELRALDKYYQRFRIDDHLKRYQSALKNLSLAGQWPHLAWSFLSSDSKLCQGSERFDEAIEYVERHQLYEYGLSIWKGTEYEVSWTFFFFLLPAFFMKKKKIDRIRISWTRMGIGYLRGGSLDRRLLVR